MDFDWSMDNAGFGGYSQEEHSKLASLYENTLNAFNEKEIVKGTVVGFTDKEVVLNIGTLDGKLVSLDGPVIQRSVPTLIVFRVLRKNEMDANSSIQKRNPKFIDL
jgi:hypothetical protein